MDLPSFATHTPEVPFAAQYLPVTVGQTYTFSGWVYTPQDLHVTGGDIDFAIDFFSGSPPNNYGGGQVLSITDAGYGEVSGGNPLPQATWTPFTVSATATVVGGQTPGSLGVYMENPSANEGANFYVDDVSLVVPEPAGAALGASCLIAALTRRRGRSN